MRTEGKKGKGISDGCANTLTEAHDEAPLDLECVEHGGCCCSLMLQRGEGQRQEQRGRPQKIRGEQTV